MIFDAIACKYLIADQPLQFFLCTNAMRPRCVEKDNVFIRHTRIIQFVQQGWQYDVAPDGRLLINTELESAAAPITLLMNWNPQSKK